ncbi:DUF952 domain-containing protein [Spirosoma sp. RP8]|uniref:DUF952 domain-containing protein n=1 Tax=Spirosoma liriopis TaxID=2937440 RepID=A0ABT0HIP8_9BACT|nr:DUF952 domain-containing protein [Spirosoma liriopis]MCK8492043.1 DUF952 domain-containing protein [Spirosoma liriopis]
MSLIYHVVPAKDWATFENKSTYEAASLQSEGFIHLSTECQVAGVLERYYQNVPDRLLLHIDPTLLTAELKYEISTNNERFPHLYGPLNKDSVLTVEHLD